MTDKQQKLEVVPPPEEQDEMPLPSDPKVIFLGGLFALALLAAVYVAAEIVLPLVLAVVLKLLLQPAMRLLERWHVPRILAALLLILAVFGTIVGLGAAIAAGWYLGGKTSRRHPSASRAAEFLAGADQHAATVFAAGGGLWTATGAPAAVSEGGSTLMTKPFHWYAELCQRLLHDNSISSFSFRLCSCAEAGFRLTKKSRHKSKGEVQ